MQPLAYPERGLCQPFNRALAGRNRHIKLYRQGAVYHAFRDWIVLLQALAQRPTHVRKLVPSTVDDVGNCDASKEGAGGVWFSTKGVYPPTVWRVQFPVGIQQAIVSEKNRTGTITNSDLEITGLLLHWLVREGLGDLRHKTISAFCDNSPTVARAAKTTCKKSTIAGRLLRALALRQRVSQQRPCSRHMCQEKQMT